MIHGVILHLAGAASCLAFSLLAWATHGEEPVRLGVLWAVLAVAWVALFAGWYCAGKDSARAVWVWAIALRLCGLVGAPVLEDDWARYLWDGRELLRTGNPYAHAPSEFFRDESVPEEFQRVLDQINHPDLPTIYGPVCETVFALGAAVAPAKLWPVKLLLVAADLAVLALILRLAGTRRAMLWGWCPLVVQEVSFTAHPDVLWVLGVVAALWCVETLRLRWAAAALGLAIAAKVFAIVVVPFVAMRLPWRHRILAALVAVAAYAPFWLQGSGADLAALRAMAGTGWEFNSPVAAPLGAFLGAEKARVVLLGILCLGWAFLFIRWHFRRGHAPFISAFSLFLACSSVVNPWYLVPLAAFLALSTATRPAVACVAALAIVSLSYAHGLYVPGAGLGAYELAAWVRPAEVTVILLGIAADCFALRRCRGTGAKWDAD